MSTNRLSPSGMSRVIDGKRYTVNTSTLLADDNYWDGNNFTKGGRNTFLFKTRGGAYFRVDMTCWQGERDSIEALTRDEAKELYERLPEHHVEFEEAFNIVVDEASAGRPTLYDEPMRQTAIWLPEEMIAWLKSQDKTLSETVRDLIKQAMDK